MKTREQEAEEYAKKIVSQAFTDGRIQIPWERDFFYTFLAGAASEAKRRDEREGRLVEALKHIKKRDLGCSPCNGRSDYDVSEHLQEVAKKALAELERER